MNSKSPRLLTCICAFTSLLLVCLPSIAETKTEAGPLKTGSAFEAELGKGIGLIRSGISLRELVVELQKQVQISILIDPRLDPSQKISVNLENVSLKLALNLIADKVNAKAKQIHNCILLLPTKNSEHIRTLVELNSDKKSKRRITFEWDRLSTSQELLTQFEMIYGIKIKNRSSVPHDLWFEGEIPDANAVETLAILLSPFDLFFEWTDERNVIRIISMPKQASLSKRLNAGKFSQQKAKQMILERYPNITIKTFGKRTLEIDSTIDTIEEIEQMLSGSSKTNTSIRKYVPLERRRYDLKVDRQPAINLIKSLMASGLSMKFDEELLRGQGILLDSQLKFEVKKATIEELMKAICSPINLDFSIKGETISLFAKKPKS